MDLASLHYKNDRQIFLSTFSSTRNKKIQVFVFFSNTLQFMFNTFEVTKKMFSHYKYNL